MTTPNDTSRIGVPRPTGNADSRRDQQSIDLLDDSPATVSRVVVRNGKLTTRSTVLAGAILAAGLVWLLTPATESVDSSNPVFGSSSQEAPVVSVAEQQCQVANPEVSDPSAFATGDGFQSLVDRAVQDGIHAAVAEMKAEPSFDQSFPLGAPHE